MMSSQPLFPVRGRVHILKWFRLISGNVATRFGLIVPKRIRQVEPFFECDGGLGSGLNSGVVEIAGKIL